MPNNSTLDQLRDTWIDAESKASEALVAYEAAAASGASVAEAYKVVELAQHAAYLAKLAYEAAREKAPLTAISEESDEAAAESSRRIEARYAKEMTAIKWKIGPDRPHFSSRKTYPVCRGSLKNKPCLTKRFRKNKLSTRWRRWPEMVAA